MPTCVMRSWPPRDPDSRRRCLARTHVCRYFGLEELITPMHCRHDPTYFKCRNGTGRYLYYNDTYVQYTIEFDGVFGPYSACNPVGKDDWTCASPCGSRQLCPGLYTSAARGGEGPPDAATCGASSCARSRTAVGWLPKKVTHSPCRPTGPCNTRSVGNFPAPRAALRLPSFRSSNGNAAGPFFALSSLFPHEDGPCMGKAQPRTAAPAD